MKTIAELANIGAAAALDTGGLNTMDTAMRSSPPAGYRAPTDAELKHLPPDSLFWSEANQAWNSSNLTGETALKINEYVVPDLGRTSDPAPEPVLFIGGCMDGRREVTAPNVSIIAIPHTPPGERGKWLARDHMQMYQRSNIFNMPTYVLVSLTRRDVMELLVKHYHPDQS